MGDVVEGGEVYCDDVVDFWLLYFDYDFFEFGVCGVEG